MRTPFQSHSHNRPSSKRSVQKQTLTQARKQTEQYPQQASGWKALGEHLLAKQPEEALDALIRAYELAPNDHIVLELLARTENVLGNSNKALEHIQRALELEPKFAQGHFLLASILYDQTQYELALKHIESADNLSPGNLDILSKKSNILYRICQFDEAFAICEKLIKQQPKNYILLNNAGNIMRDIGEFEEADKYYRKSVQFANDDAIPFSNRLTTLHYRPAYSREQIFEICKEWQTRFAPASRATRPRPDNISQDKRIRIGMISDGFRSHPVGWMTIATLENLKKHEIELYAYSTNTAVDNLTTRIQAAAYSWVSVQHLSDKDLAQRILDDRIDILVDLCGHNNGSRMRVMTMEPAPILLKWVGGLINTTGLEAFDYLLTDNIESPSGEDAFYTEKLIRLPDDYICFTPPSYQPKISGLPALRNGYITLGCFNNPIKVNEVLLAEWAKLMHELPNSRLFLKGHQYNSKQLSQRVRDILSANGISAERVTIEGPSTHQKLLETYNQIDIALDPWPYSGGLTTCEAMLMGVPVVTMPGPTFAGRHSATHLVNAGMPELVVDNWDEYRERVIGLASDLESLATIRTHLRNVLLESPVCDGPRFARHFSTAMRAIWQRYCEGKAPEALAIDKEGQVWFDGDTEPVEIQQPTADKVEEDGFSFSFTGKIVVLDNGASLVGEPGYINLHKLGVFSTVVFDPAGIVNNTPHLQRYGELHHLPHATLGDGNQATLYNCLNPAFSATLEPLPAAQQMPDMAAGAQVIAKLPISTHRLDAIEGLGNVDWLLLDNLNDSLNVLKNSSNTLANTLLVQTRISFSTTHSQQPEIAPISQWLSQQGFKFYRLNNLHHHSYLPKREEVIKTQATQLASADAIFIPNEERLVRLSKNQLLKLAFLLHTVYGTRDLTAKLLGHVDIGIANSYLHAENYINDSSNTLSTNELAHTNVANLIKHVLARKKPIQRQHGLPGRLVITLTSYKKRFNTLHLTLKCLLTQTTKADRIILWIAEQEKELLPQNTLDMINLGLEINYYKDIRSFKKIIPTIECEPNSFLVTADDDLYYHTEWLAELLDAWDGNPNLIVAHRAHKIKLNGYSLPRPYKEWEAGYHQPNEASNLIFPTTGGGVLYPPQAFHPDVTQQHIFQKLCPDADDIWLYWMSALNGKTFKVVGKPFTMISWPETQDEALWHHNLGRGGNDRQIKAMIRNYGFPALPPKSISNSSKNRDDDIHSFLCEKTRINFYLPNPEDHIQRIIKNNSIFYEQEMLFDIKSRVPKNGTIIDIGANIGNHSIFFAKLCQAKRVFSFEPQPAIYNILLKNIALNNTESIIKPYNIGLGREHAFATLGQIDKINLGMTKIAIDNSGDIPVAPLDSIVYTAGSDISAIKIDVEGMELEVLAGATKILSKHNPIIYAEAGTDMEFNKLRAYLAQFRYKPISRFNATATYLFVKS